MFVVQGASAGHRFGCIIIYTVFLTLPSAHIHRNFGAEKNLVTDRLRVTFVTDLLHK